MTQHPESRPNPEAHAPAQSWRFNPCELYVFDATGHRASHLLPRLAECLPEDIRAATARDVTPANRIAPSCDSVRLLYTDSHQILSVSRREPDDVTAHVLLDYGAVLIETIQPGTGPRLVLMGDGRPPVTEDVVAYAADATACPVLPANAPFFTLEQIPALAQHVAEWFNERAFATPVHGLVLAGGVSRRMNQDKAQITYHGKPQADYAADLLSTVCDRVFVSVRSGQPAGDHAMIEDRFVGFGPMGGLLTAMTEHPSAAWCVLACDLPFVEQTTLQQLLDARNPFARATVFEREGHAEPCCAIYEPKAIHALLRQMALGEYSLQSILEGPAVKRFAHADPFHLTNVNTPSERDAAKRLLARRRIVS